MLIFIDIETIPNLQSNLANIIEKKHNSDGQDNWLSNNGALYPETGTIKAIGFGTETGKQNIQVGNEIELLNKFSELCTAKDLTFVGWNIKRFDIPYIIKKYAMNNKELPDSLKGYARRKPRDLNVIDLMEVWSGGSARWDSLETCCLALGLDNPKEDNHGDQVKNMTDEEVKQYLTKDIDAVRNIYTKFKNLRII